MKVWLAFRGEKYEGDRVLGVFATFRGAVKCALSQSCHYGDKYWRLQHPWNIHGYTWENGCDEVSVWSYEVQP